MTDSFQNSRLNKLAIKMKGGDMMAAEKIFEHYSSQMFRYFMKRTLNRDIAEDLTQDVFLRIVKKIDSYNPEVGNFSSWIWQIAKNKLIDYYREKKTVPLEDYYCDKSDIEDRDDKLDKLSRVEDILRIIKDFNPLEQEVFSLYYVSDLSYKEISEMVGKSEGALRILIHRVNNKIKKIINE